MNLISKFYCATWVQLVFSIFKLVINTQKYRLLDQLVFKLIKQSIEFPVIMQINFWKILNAHNINTMTHVKEERVSFNLSITNFRVIFAKLFQNWFLTEKTNQESQYYALKLFHSYRLISKK